MSKCIVSWSSGKDSAWLVHVLRAGGVVEIGALLTTVNESAARVAMHAVRVELLEAQAAALGLPLWQIPIPSPCPNEVYERRMAEAVRRAVAEGFTHIAFGDLFLEDIRRYREERLASTGLTPIFPVFGIDTTSLAQQMVNGGLHARLTCVDPRVLGAPFAGREFDAAFLAELHTIPIEPGAVVERDGFVFADLMLA
jgi:diphthamide synthase (EF-2-diphthine--ammonia ligase)